MRVNGVSGHGTDKTVGEVCMEPLPERAEQRQRSKKIELVGRLFFDERHCGAVDPSGKSAERFIAQS